MLASYVRRRIASFGYAFRGFGVLMSQHNARIHVAAAVVATVAGLLLRISAAEWCWVVLAIVTVVSSEALDTAIELVANKTSPEYHPLIGKAKDVAATGVLVCAIGSVIIAALVFGHHIVALFR
jgi:diacylglycerol kinase (ATP)